MIVLISCSDDSYTNNDVNDNVDKASAVFQNDTK